MIQFQKSNPSKPRFAERTWRRILAHENLDLECWETPQRGGGGLKGGRIKEALELYKKKEKEKTQ